MIHRNAEKVKARGKCYKFHSQLWLGFPDKHVTLKVI